MFGRTFKNIDDFLHKDAGKKYSPKYFWPECKKPKQKDEAAIRQPKVILEEMKILDEETQLNG